jgi:hypothetical protein
VANSIGLRWRFEPAFGGEFTGPRNQAQIDQARYRRVKAEEFGCKNQCYPNVNPVGQVAKTTSIVDYSFASVVASRSLSVADATEAKSIAVASVPRR